LLVISEQIVIGEIEMNPEIQLPLFPIRKEERASIDAHAALQLERDAMTWVVRTPRTHGPVCVHYLPFIGAWVVSTMAPVIGPTGNRAVKVPYVFPRVFLLNELAGAIRFANRAGAPYLEQTFHYVASCIASGRRVGMYEDFPYG
jgi:hypothetical protein